MTGLSNEELAQMTIYKLWSMIRDPRLKGLTPYEAARAMSLGEASAKIVADRWDGPKIFPGP